MEHIAFEDELWRLRRGGVLLSACRTREEARVLDGKLRPALHPPPPRSERTRNGRALDAAQDFIPCQGLTECHAAT